MDSSVIWRIVLFAIAAWLAVKLILWIFGIFIGLLQTAVMVAIIIGVIYLLYALFGRRKSAY